MKFNSFIRRSLIGLDVQPDAARLIQLKKTKQGMQLVRIAMQPMPSNIFSAGKIVEWEMLSIMLMEWFKRLKVQREVIAIGLPMSMVHVKQITLPAGLTEVEIETEIIAHLQHDMPGLGEALSIDYHVLRSSTDTIEILFLAVREVYLSRLIECVQAAGLPVKIVDVDTYALMRAIPVTSSPYAILWVKNKITQLIIVNKQQVVFQQEWETTSLKVWLSSLQEKLKLLPLHLSLQQFVVCGPACYQQAVRGELGANIASPIVPFTLATCLSQQEEILKEQAADFLIAYGLAMRAIPVW